MPPLQSVRILDQLRERIRYLHYSLRTDEAYVYCARAFIRFHGLRHPREMGKAEIEAFLMALVSKRNVSSSTHRQALSSLLFLYGKVLGVDLLSGRDRQTTRGEAAAGYACLQMRWCGNFIKWVVSFC